MNLIFDWGDTIMRDQPGMPGPMAEWDTVEYIPGAEQALQDLSGSFFCAIATNAGVSDTKLMRKALERVGADRFFQFFTSSRDLHSEKPDPLFFLKIASILGVKPEECIHIGNVYEKDVVGAAAAGMRTIFFNEKNEKGFFPAANRVITHMSALAETVRELVAASQLRLEICCDSLRSAVAAEEGGADRIELCAGLAEGGVTPSIASVMAVLNTVRLPVNVLVRPRPGNFNYDEQEVKSMLRDIAFLKKAGVNGIVCGALDDRGHVDQTTCKAIIDCIGDLDSTFHRAFDLTPNAALALEEICSMGFRRILTSGQTISADAGSDLLAALVDQAGDRISVMPGAGINEENIRELALKTRAREFHMSLRVKQEQNFALENLGTHTAYMEVSVDKVRRVRQLLTGLKR